MLSFVATLARELLRLDGFEKLPLFTATDVELPSEFRFVRDLIFQNLSFAEVELGD